MSRLELRYASQIHSDPRWNLQALFLNTRVPPFNRLDARKAINFAVDRAAATNAWGGPSVAEPTCQILPPNFPGYRPYCPYTAGSTKSGKWTAPDLAKARALVARSGTRGMKVTVWAWSQAKGFNRVAVKVLHSLGYRVAVKPVVGDRYWGAVGDSRNRAQIGFDGLRPSATRTRRRSWFSSSAVQRSCPGTPTTRTRASSATRASTARCGGRRQSS